MNFDFECDKSYYRLFIYFINKRYKKHALLYNIIDKNLISKIDIHFYFKYYKFIIKNFVNNFNYLYNIIYVAIEIF